MGCGEQKYGVRKATVEDPNWRGPRFSTCAHAATACRAFETCRRRQVLSFSHHIEVASLDDPVEADALLDWCEETIPATGEPRSVRELREAVALRGHAMSRVTT
jgi:hypothetical protein